MVSIACCDSAAARAGAERSGALVLDMVKPVESGKWERGVKARATRDAMLQRPHAEHPTPHLEDTPTAACAVPSLLSLRRANYPPPMSHRRTAHLGSACPAGVRGACALLLAAVISLALGCGEGPVEWSAMRTATAASSVQLAHDGALRPDTMAALAARVRPPEGSVCPGSLVVSRAGSRLYAAWWRVQPDSGAFLLAAHSDDDGGAWSVPSPVDTTDQSVTGCDRAPSAIAADSASGYVHVGFSLLGKEGPGLFYAHSMDAGATFHAAVPIFYGDRLGRSSVAADGDIVVVAFEDPNSRSPRVGLALSRTMGHIFEERLLPVSDDNGTATHPLAAVRGRRIAVAWQRAVASDGTPAVLAIRTG